MPPIAVLRSEVPDKWLRENARESLAEGFVFDESALGITTPEQFARSFNELDRRLKHGYDLSAVEAYHGMMHVLAATNRRVMYTVLAKGCYHDYLQIVARAIGFLQGMACKAAWSQLTVPEVVGMIEAASHDIIVRLKAPDNRTLVEMCGMGGDKGRTTADGDTTHKTLNMTTLTALCLGALGYPAVKHGSAKNTSAVGSTDFIRHIGIPYIYHSVEEMQRTLNDRGFVVVDASLAKTLHDASHLLRVETINHLLGPLTLPVERGAPVDKILGINEKVDPITCACACVALAAKGVTNFRNVGVICALPSECDPNVPLYRQAILDEVGPAKTLLHLVVNGQYVDRQFILTPANFGLSEQPEAWVPNNEGAILEANQAVLRGERYTDYLAMSVALACYVASPDLESDQVVDRGINDDRLRVCYEQAQQLLTSGQLLSYVQSLQ